MQYNSHATNQDIVSEINFWCDSDATSYPIADKTRSVNVAYEELIGKIINADGTWQYDDTNYSNLPRGKGTLVEGQEWYSFASEYLKIEEIHILTTGNLYQKIPQIDNEVLGELSWEEYFGRDSSGNALKGFPLYYDILGDSIRLGPTPTSTQVTLTNGIQIVFKRTADLFTTTDTTQEPGLPSLYHVLLAYKAALPYCMKYKKENVSSLLRLIGSDNSRDPYYGGMTLDLIKHYSKRNPDNRPIMTMKRINHI